MVCAAAKLAQPHIIPVFAPAAATPPLEQKQRFSEGLAALQTSHKISDRVSPVCGSINNDFLSELQPS
ncbi:MAG TPA: hypothetical protein VFX76_13205, partial [Roseiflexaceae bacterium]|nr:hypothetical protein [Roseiflexaceae bacterium]